jgi:glycerol-1-phosphate dehydrogenase [NAD(P)+]
MQKSASLAEALHFASDTRALEIGKGVIQNAPRVFLEQFGNRAAIIVADRNTYRIAGQIVADAFRAAKHPTLEPFIFPLANLYAEHTFVEQLESALRKQSAIPIAVGAGTLNDIAKLAAHRTGRPYMCVATAASMDGYTAFGASITFNGSKQTFTCPAPVAVIADLDVICAAPAEMTASGYADLLAKTTAGADWIVADALGVEPIDSLAWNIVQGRLREFLSVPRAVRNGNKQAIAGLTEGLMLGGFAMQAAKSSRPASGAEHQFSHLWDMQHHTHNPDGSGPSHGFKVGIGTLAVAALYEFLLKQPVEALDVEQCCAAWPEPRIVEETIRRSFAIGELAEKAIEETRAKHVSREALREHLDQLRGVWPQLKEGLERQLLPYDKLRNMLREAGAPHEPEHIGISRARLRESFRQAYFIRRRYTVLDLAVRTGLLERALVAIFGGNGVWPIHPAVCT